MTEEQRKVKKFLGGAAEIERLKTKSLFRGYVQEILFPDEGEKLLEIGVAEIEKSFNHAHSKKDSKKDYKKEWAPFSPGMKFYIRNFQVKDIEGGKIEITSPTFSEISVTLKHPTMN